MERIVELHDWKFVNRLSNPCQAPEMGAMVLQGEAVGHPMGPDGPVTTTRIKSFDHETMIAKTKNTTYQLKRINNDFSEWLSEKGIDISEYSTR